MASFCMTKNAQTGSGDHKVHRAGSYLLPSVEYMIYIENTFVVKQL